MINTEAVVAGRRKQIEDGQKYYQDFADEQYWLELFKQYRIPKPAYYLPPTKKLMRKYLRKVHVTEKEYKMITAFDDLDEFAKLNPTWPLWAWLGTVLEYVEERDQLRIRMQGDAQNK